MTDIERHLQLILEFIDRGFAAGANKALGETRGLTSQAAQLENQLSSTDARLRATGMSATMFASDVRAGAVSLDDFKAGARALASEVEDTGPKMLVLRERSALLIEDFQKGKITTEEFRRGITAIDAASLGSLKERSGALAAEMQRGELTVDDFKRRAHELGNEMDAASPKMQRLREKSAGLVQDLAAGRISPQRFREEIDKLDLSARRVNFDKLRSSVRDLGRDLLIGGAAATGFTAGFFKLVQMGGEINQTRQAFKATIDTFDLAPDSLERIRTQIHGVVSDSQLMVQTTKMLMTGIDPSRIVELWGKARQISIIGHKDINDVAQALATSIQSGNTEMLRQIGIVISAERVYRDYATALGKPTEELSNLDRQFAISMEIERIYRERFKGLGDISGGVAEKFHQLGAGTGNLKDKLLGMIAGSPAIQKFLADLITKTDDWLARLDKAGPAVDKITTDVTRVYKSLVAFGSENVGPAIENIYKYRDALAAIGVTLGTGLLASKLMGIGVALGLVTGATAATIVGIAAVAAGLGTAMVLEMKDSDKGAGELNATLRVQHYLLKQAGRINWYGLETPPWNYIKDRIADLEAMNAEIERTGKQKQTAEVDVKINLPTGISAMLAKISASRTAPNLPGTTPKPMEADLFKSTPPPGPNVPAFDFKAWLEEKHQVRELMDEEADFYDKNAEKMTAIAQTHSEQVQAIHAGKTDYEMMLEDQNTEHTRQQMEFRTQLVMRGFEVMGMYSSQFYAKNANMGRVLNAMLIRGFGEVVSVALQTLAKEAAFRAAFYAAQAWASAASLNFGAAAAFTKAAAEMAILAGVGYAAAGYISYQAAGKAEKLASRNEEEQLGREASAGESNIGQRKQASGVVQTRPINITIYSTANFNAGTMIFGDGERAVHELYGRSIRPRIEEDIQTGVIAIPA
jgi:hypothetical protein